MKEGVQANWHRANRLTWKKKGDGGDDHYINKKKLH
jgi:hypothetical protein